jgi:hypothetical protein
MPLHVKHLMKVWKVLPEGTSVKLMGHTVGGAGGVDDAVIATVPVGTTIVVSVAVAVLVDMPVGMAWDVAVDEGDDVLEGIGVWVCVAMLTCVRVGMPVEVAGGLVGV